MYKPILGGANFCSLFNVLLPLGNLPGFLSNLAGNGLFRSFKKKIGYQSQKFQKLTELNETNTSSAGFMTVIVYIKSTTKL